MSYRKLIVNDYHSDDEGAGRQVASWTQKGSGGGEVTDQRKTSKNAIKAYAEDRQRKLLTIILKLAVVKGYNNLGNIKLPNGSYLPKSDVVPLILYVLSREKPIAGIGEFIELLREAGVTPDLVTNEAVRQKLQSRQSYQNHIQHFLPQAEEQDEQEEHTDVPMTEVPSSRKRSYDDDNDDDDSPNNDDSSISSVPPPPLLGPYTPASKRKRTLDEEHENNKKRKREIDNLAAAHQKPLPYDSDSNDDY